MNKVVDELKKDNEYDIIVVENTYQIGMLLKKHNIKNTFLHLHNDYLNNTVKLSKKIFDSYNRILTVSEFIKNRVETISNENKITTLYNGVDIIKFNKSLYTDEIDYLRQSYGIKKGDIVIVFSGRLVPEKGIKELLEAFVEMKFNESVKLMIIGSSIFKGSKKTSFIKSLENIAYKKKEQIIFTGYVPHDDMPKLYSIADIGVIPSMWEEPFGLTLVEQMAMELPVITSDSGAITEIVNNDCGILVKRDENFVNNLKNSIEYLIENEQIRKKMGYASRERSKAFSEKLYCEKFYNILREYKYS